MKCPVAEVQPSGTLIGTTILPSLIKDKTCSIEIEQLGSSQADRIFFFLPLYLFLLSFLPLALANVSKQRSWKDFLNISLFFVVTARICGEAQSASDRCCSLTHFILSKVPCDCRRGTKAVSWWVLAQAKPWKFIMLANSKDPHSAEEH